MRYSASTAWSLAGCGEKTRLPTTAPAIAAATAIASQNSTRPRRAGFGGEGGAEDVGESAFMMASSRKEECWRRLAATAAPVLLI
ncbi:hypothetical protein GCM10009078_37150 [Cupriavidus gilardii]